MGRLALAIDIHKISNFVFLLPIYNNVVRRLKRQKYLIRNEASKKNCKRLNILFHTPAFQRMHIFFSFIKRNNYPGISSSSEHHIHEKSTNSASFVCGLTIIHVLLLAFQVV